MPVEANKPSQLPLFSEEIQQHSSQDLVPASARERAEIRSDSSEFSSRTEEQQTLYEELIQLSEEWTSTLWIDPLYKDKYDELMALTAARGAKAGLGENDISQAIQEGKERGQALRSKPPEIYL